MRDKGTAEHYRWESVGRKEKNDDVRKERKESQEQAKNVLPNHHPLSRAHRIKTCSKALEAIPSISANEFILVL